VTVANSAAAHFAGYFRNPKPKPVRTRLLVAADDEVAVTVNGQTIIESLGWKSRRKYGEKVLLPPGPSEIRIFYHKFWHPGGMVFVSFDDAGQRVPWTCDRDFH